LLAEKRRGGCRAAGCVAMGGELNDNTQEGESQILRAVTAKQVALLQAAKPAMPKSFFMHVVGQQRAFAKDEKRVVRGLAKAMKTSPPSDMGLFRDLVEEAARKGFRSHTIDEAVKVVAEQDRQERMLAVFRRLPGAVIDYVARTSLDAARRSIALKTQIIKLENTVEDLTRTVRQKELIAAAQAGVLKTERAKAEAGRNEAAAQAKYCREEMEALRATIDYVEDSAASDRERATRMESDLVAKLSTADGTIATLTETVAEQQLAAQKESERSELALRVVVGELEASQQEAEKVREELSEALNRGIELDCLLDMGQDMRTGLEDELTLCRTNVDEARTIAESYGADLEDLDSRALAVALALVNDVAERALQVESLAHVAQGAVLGVTPAFDSEDRWGSHAGYSTIRSHLEAVQRLVVRTTETLVEEVSGCEAAEARAMDREASTQEKLKEVEDDLIACNMSDGSTTDYSTTGSSSSDSIVSGSGSIVSGSGSIVSDSSGGSTGSNAASDSAVTGVDVENDTDTAGDDEEVDLKEADNDSDGHEKEVGVGEDDAFSTVANPPTLDGV
ncbi:unnamed protein product, partial [Ectocarpus fasciculatus]